MKKFVFFFLFLFFAVPSYSSDSIPSDDCFSISFWFTVPVDNGWGASGNSYTLFTISDGFNTWFADYSRTQMFAFWVSSQNAYEKFYGLPSGSLNGDISPGKHLYTMNYCSSNPYSQYNMTYSDASITSTVYIDGVALGLFYSAGVLPLTVQGDLSFGGSVLDYTFLYSSTPLTSAQISQMFSIGVLPLPTPLDTLYKSASSVIDVSKNVITCLIGVSLLSVLFVSYSFITRFL